MTPPDRWREAAREIARIASLISHPLSPFDVEPILRRLFPAREEGWISVSEKLPPDNEGKNWKDGDHGEQFHCSDVVLAFNGVQVTAEMLTNPRGESVWVCGDETVKDVTYWRELGPDPKSTESERQKEGRDGKV